VARPRRDGADVRVSGVRNGSLTRQSVCAFSSPVNFNGAFADPKTFAKKVRLLWLGVGTAEPERMREGIRGFHKAPTDAGIDGERITSGRPGDATCTPSRRGCFGDAGLQP
jgi:hypothetical protein